MPRRIRRLRARRRLRQINARRVQRALLTSGRAPASPPTPRRPGPDTPTTYGAPRSLLYLRAKRDNTSWRTLYGHWWLELDDDESYGWWPATVPLRFRDLLRGTGGVLNGVGLLGMKGSWSRDPNHGLPAVHVFHPVLEVVKSDEQLRQDVRRFAHAYRTRWRWHWSAHRSAGTCRGFQDDLFAAVGLSDGTGRLHTRGSGCPFLYQLRRPWWSVADRLDRLRRPDAPAASPATGARPPRATPTVSHRT